MVAETVIDEKGRIVIPRRLREKLKMHKGVRVRLVLEGGKIAIVKPVTPDEFIEELEGFVDGGSPVPKIDPLQLKRIWELP